MAFGHGPFGTDAGIQEKKIIEAVAIGRSNPRAT
jgi:hypothetical protein